jgi:outer membrane protein
MLNAARSRLRANIVGLAAADLALKGVRAEYGFGLRSTVDILVADQSFRAAQLAVALARTDVLIAEAALLRAAGRLDRNTYR